MKFRLVPAIVLMLSLCVAAEKPAHAGLLFWKNKKKTASTTVSEKPVKPSKNIRVTETQDFIILFFFTGQHEKRPNELGDSRRYLEISYKFSIRAENPEQYFGGPDAWMKVRFLDSEGFSLAEDPVNYKDLLRGKEHYGFAWVEERKAGVLRNADLKPLRQDEVPAPGKVQESAPKETAQPEAAKAEEKTAASAPDKTEKPVVPATEASATNPQPPEPSKAAEQQSSAAAAQPAAEEEAGLTRGGATNAEVTAALDEINKKPPTEIPEGRDSLPPGTGETKEA